MKNKQKRLKLFDLGRDGKGISKSDAEKKGSLKRFFISYKDNFGKITTLNIFMVVGNFPLMFLIITLSGLTKNIATMPLFDVFQNLSGYFVNNLPSAHSMSMFAHQGLQGIVYKPTLLTYIFYALSGLFLFTFGIVNVGTAYILRNIAKGDPVFLWSDFWYAVKRNWKQALPFGMLDLGINALLIWNIYNMSMMTDTFTNIVLCLNIAIFILYFVMRFYVYVQMVTFKLSLFKIVKNSLIFAILGFKRNIMAMLGIIIILVIESVCVFGAGGILLPFAIALPFLIMFSTLSYMKVYASYFKIKQVMIDPYIEEHPEENSNDESYQDAIMTDDVTQQQHLEEIKKRMN